jgi:hypothetical protein
MVATIMLDKELAKNQVSPVTPSLQPGRPANDTSFKPGHGGQRRGSGRPRGSQNRVTSIFRDILLAAISEVGDSQTVGVDGVGGLKAYLKMCAVLERKTTLLLVGRILPLKISTEVKQVKETMTIHEAVADLKACGLDPLLAFYLSRYPIGRDEKDTSWAEGIDVSLARDPPIDVTPEKDDTENGTGNDTGMTSQNKADAKVVAEYIDALKHAGINVPPEVECAVARMGGWS